MRPKVKVLAIDIGAGTQDILLYDSRKKLENCVKLVLPSPSPLLAARVDAASAKGGNLFIGGYTVGGGSLSRAVKRHLASGGRVFMTPKAAFIMRNNLEDVASLGVEIRDEPPPGFDGTVIEADELNLAPLGSLLASVGEGLDALDAVAVAVQDHGSYRPGESNRKTRLSHMQGRLEADPDPLALSYLAGEVPPQFPRMTSAAAGCLADALVAERAEGDLLVINAGNGHTLAYLLRGGKVAGVFEHHTKKLEPASFAAYLASFWRGEARDSDEYVASGHGLFYVGGFAGMEGPGLIAVTGPNREILEGTGLDVYYPSPGGDMMMTGPMGLVRATLSHL